MSLSKAELRQMLQDMPAHDVTKVAAKRPKLGRVVAEIFDPVSRRTVYARAKITAQRESRKVAPRGRGQL